MEPILVAIPEAGRVIGVSRSKVKQLMTAGDLPSVKIGERRLIPVEGLHAYVARLLAEQQRAG